MLLNNAVSIAAGTIPFVGDIVLALYKANSRNAALLEEFLRIRGEEYIKLRADGKDPEKIVVEARAAKKEKKKNASKSKENVEEKSKEKKEDATNGKEKEKTEEIVEGVTKGDVAQVIPGAGKESGEIILETMPGGTGSVTDAPTVTATTVLADDFPKATKSNPRRKLFRRPFGKKAPARQSRFVENMDSDSPNVVQT